MWTGLIFGVVVAALGPQAATETPVSFIEDVAPILREYCFACHDARKRAGKYDLTRPESLFAGGSNGEPIVPGHPEESDLYLLMVTTEPRRMPPRDKGEPVPPQKAALIARWIREGAKLDPGLAPSTDLIQELRRRWQPPKPPTEYPYPVPVTALAVAPNQQQLVVGGYHELLVYSYPDGQLRKRIRTRAAQTLGLAFLPDGRLAVAGGRPGQEGDVRIYDLSADQAHLDGVADTAVMRQQLWDCDDSVLALALSHDGKTLAAGGCDRVIRLWDLSHPATPQLTDTIESHTDWILGLAFSPDGRLVGSASRDRTVKVWDRNKKESVVSIPDHQAPVYGVAFSSDGRVGFSVGADKIPRSWPCNPDNDTATKTTGPKNRDGHTDIIHRVVLSPDGSRLATASADRTIRLWSVNPLKLEKTLTGLSDFALSVAFSPDGRHVIAGSYDGSVCIWSVPDGQKQHDFRVWPKARQ